MKHHWNTLELLLRHPHNIFKPPLGQPLNKHGTTLEPLRHSLDTLETSGFNCFEYPNLNKLTADRRTDTQTHFELLIAAKNSAPWFAPHLTQINYSGEMSISPKWKNINITLYSYQLFQNPKDKDYEKWKNNTVFPSIFVEVAHPEVRSWIETAIAINGYADYCAN